MTRVERVPATEAMALDLAPRLRHADRLEVSAASGVDADFALLYGVKASRRCDAWLVDGVPQAIAGVRDSATEGVGVVWMLASDEADKFPKHLLKGNREYVDCLLEMYDAIGNFVDNRNTRAQRWLRWLGFEMGEPVAFGVEGLPFRPFWKRRVEVDSHV